MSAVSAHHPLESRAQSAGRRIPVVLAESGTTYGGTEKVVSELALRLDRTRFQPWVVLSPGPALDRMAGDLERGGVPVERVAEITNRFQFGAQTITTKVFVMVPREAPLQAAAIDVTAALCETSRSLALRFPLRTTARCRRWPSGRASRRPCAPSS